MNKSYKHELSTRTRTTAKALLLLAVGLIAPAVHSDESAGMGAVTATAATYTATVKRGPYGVPHISADDFGSLGYGEAHAAAEDHVCTIAYGLVEARGEKSLYFGAGKDGSNVASDALVGSLDIGGQAETALAAQGMDIREWIRGYAAGYNRYLREHTGMRNNSWCSGAPWLSEASAEDFMARMVMLALTLPRMAGAVAATQPPSATDSEVPPQAVLDEALAAAALQGRGSNGWAMGRDKTENGRGILLANPHYPWYGGLRFWEKHLTIPGKLDTYGAVTLGAPGVAIGFNKALGWTHTVSASQRIVLYRLVLDPENPMRYRYGDDWRNIEAREQSVTVSDAEGKQNIQTKTVYFSHYGPLVTLPNMAWDAKYAYTARDANMGNYWLLAQWLSMGQAKNMDEFIDAHRRFNAMPWVNTIAASADGRALYLDNSTVGNLSDKAQDNWRASLQKDRLAAGLYQQRRMVLLNGSDPANEWIEVDGVPIPGTTPFESRPRIERADYVFNSNDSYWLSNPDEPLTGASILYGPTGSARTLRTRMNLRLLADHYDDAGADDRFNIHEVQAALFANRGLSAEILLPDLLETCAAAPESLAEACAVLTDYDGSLNLDSPGAVLFREWITRYDPLETVNTGKLFRSAFAVENPAETPAKLGDTDLALENLQSAVDVLNTAGLPLNASLREAQFAWRGGEAIPVHGGNSHEGVANLQMAGDPSASPIAGVTPEPVGDSRFLTDAGYPVVHGSSFIMTLGFDDEGPVAEALLSYSQSGNPKAAHFRDQTDLYARKEWRSVAFSPEDINATATSMRILRSTDEQ